MNIRLKLILRFTASVATILISFSMAIYLLSENYRREEFYSRLESRAITTARLLVTVTEVDMDMLRIIDKNSIHALFEEKVLIFNNKDSLLYSSLDDLPVPHSSQLLAEIRKKRKLEYAENGVEHVGLIYGDNPAEEVVVISSAFDRYGKSKLQNLQQVLWAGLIIGILIVILTGAVYAEQVLRPLTRLNSAVSSISAGNLSKRVDEGNRRDEMAQLAMNFNQMLHRLESAFEVQRQFVSNASHELRNPLTAMNSQLQLMLGKRRSAEEYETALQVLLEETRTLIDLINGLLALAQSGVDKHQFQSDLIRVDETVFAAQHELSKAHPDYHFLIEYDAFPDEESHLTIAGSEHLLKTAFINLMDNACKYSDDQTVRIRFVDEGAEIGISFQDNGIGIPEAEQSMIFTPFFRGSNVKSIIKGQGIGLALAQRIIQLHDGHIRVHSARNKGCLIKLRFPHKGNNV